ncbi:hypothetical protein RIF29_13491 [Crotalaria pallida]|uniref:Uncharacterized protein n=1 Tax=Crotalaria pallida TaxID=3830 RepID=A0AAN9P277_CROPI
MANSPPPRRQSSRLPIRRLSQQPLPTRPQWQPPMLSPQPVQPPPCLPQSSYYMLPQSLLPMVMQSTLLVVVAPPLLPNNVNCGHVLLLSRSNLGLDLQAQNPLSLTRHGWGNHAPFATRYEPYGQGPCFFEARPYDFGPYHCVRSPSPQPQVNVNAFLENWNNMEMVRNQTSASILRRHGTGVFHALPHSNYANNESSKNNNIGMRQNQESTSTLIKISNQTESLVKQEEYNQGSLSFDFGLPEKWPY